MGRTLWFLVSQAGLVEIVCIGEMGLQAYVAPTIGEEYQMAASQGSLKGEFLLTAVITSV
jgi:hypothetical protein